MVLGAPSDLRVRCSEGRPRPSRNAPCLWWPSTPWNAPQSCATKREPLVTKPGQAPWGVDPIGMALYRITGAGLFRQTLLVNSTNAANGTRQIGCVPSEDAVALRTRASGLPVGIARTLPVTHQRPRCALRVWPLCLGTAPPARRTTLRLSHGALGVQKLPCAPACLWAGRWPTRDVSPIYGAQVCKGVWLFNGSTALQHDLMAGSAG